MTETLKLNRNEFTFEWAGGPYIEIARKLQPEQAFEVINVSGADQPFTPQGLAALVDGYLLTFGRPAKAYEHLRNVAHNTLDF
ncbi:hypothetical protein SEA_YEET_199 [Mycobacterium phage Yeet]|uniref:Uncharacterized protein n=2 Tax=Omegavirus baka TaxID=1034099 RepID=A0A3S9UB82_9CAUD|nr:hypothetical protein N857_gp216 [Mycobacterium phage Wanda]YP_009636386.1 hypothetical protein FGG20_gp217 [Mycobacterium phage Baka]ATN89920.1 hypothetical protein SEA_KLEIN_214 [Mycobacterium phage Klein]AXQ52196.1 hypothetical protein SEA_EJIMIX_197 [Mycobacterium phage Ejimix]AXQ52435.1 hypothetical protein SEA_ERICMILLARD_205 [Mycobacterium phage EricMillard]AYB69695.1 hypothetical protein SEA_KALAH2_209 [Mycobacterium phage Kalah2]AZS07544.1 hypothetical protein PBI_DUKE13_208 [Mycob